MSDAVEFFNEEMAKVYDERNSKLAPLKKALHLTLKLVMNELPEASKILCVGAGTGEEILDLAEMFPKWTFVALEPSKSMLDICKKRVEAADLLNRCEFFQGYVHELKEAEDYNAVISLFVGHFIPAQDRASYFHGMTSRLFKGGTLVNVEIGFDQSSKEFPQMLEKWKEVQRLMGASEESLETIKSQFEKSLTVLPPQTTEEQIKSSGIKLPIRFFQALMICGWFGKKL
jgi:tRNA (cmo5U34)-methyltransferase